jgi:type I restriction enzyme M protein
VYLSDASRFSKLLNLPEGADIGKAINEAMRAIEPENEEFKDIMPKTYNHLDNSILVELLKTFNSVPMDIEGDAFGKIYEIFSLQIRHERGTKRRRVLYTHFYC